MKKFKCSVCGYIYDEANGDPKGHVLPGTEWKDVPKDWLCPICKADKSAFSEIVSEEK